MNQFLSMLVSNGAAFRKNGASLRKNDSGQGLVEYALILSLVSIVAIAALGPLGTAVAAIYTSITTTLG